MLRPQAAARGRHRHRRPLQISPGEQRGAASAASSTTVARATRPGVVAGSAVTSGRVAVHHARHELARAARRAVTRSVTLMPWMRQSILAMFRPRTDGRSYAGDGRRSKLRCDLDLETPLYRVLPVAAALIGDFAWILTPGQAQRLRRRHRPRHFTDLPRASGAPEHEIAPVRELRPRARPDVDGAVAARMDPDLHHVFMVGAEDPARLSRAERVRFSWALYQLFGAGEFDAPRVPATGRCRQSGRAGKPRSVGGSRTAGCAHGGRRNLPRSAADFEAFGNEILRKPAYDPRRSRAGMVSSPVKALPPSRDAGGPTTAALGDLMPQHGEQRRGAPRRAPIAPLVDRRRTGARRWPRRSTSALIEADKGRAVFSGNSGGAAFTTRSAWCTAAMPRRCSIPRAAAPCIRASAGRPTLRSSSRSPFTARCAEHGSVRAEGTVPVDRPARGIRGGACHRR